MKNINNKIILKRRIIILWVITFILFFTIIIKITNMQLINNKGSLEKLNKMSVKTVYGDAMPRGKIYDRNYKVIVDNVGIYIITYNKNNLSVKEEIKLAYKLANNIDINYSFLQDINLREFWLANNTKKADNKITKEEYKLYERRKLKSSDLQSLKLKRITEEELSKFNEIDKKAAYIYYLMNNGYSYEEKVLKEEASIEEYNFILDNKDSLSGIEVKTTWKRVYPYGDTLKQILGVVSTSKQGIPKDKKEEYLKKGYELNDRVGLSYLELEYEDYLKGTKDTYKLQNGKKTLIKKGSKGNDLVLSIDIDLQLELEKIMEEEIINAKNDVNTEYYDHTSTIITNPKTGEILAIASKKILNTTDGYKIIDNTTSILTSSDTPGSIVKGASMLVGYNSGKLNIGDSFYDKCIKFKNTPKKCSWSTSLGKLNDINALKMSSNSYQFQLALKIANVNYYYNMPVNIDNTAINYYRDTFKQLGLGVKSEIDLPNETIGYVGKESNAGLLLNFSIGQYDTYSVLQLSSYINTIINNGNRLKLNLVSEIRKATKDDSLGDVVKKYEPVTLNKVNIKEEYFNRVKEGFISVLSGPLGKGYMGNINNPAGKTGTSESFYDSDGDNIVDKETYTKSFIGYAPYDNPVMSIVSISPHAGRKSTKSSYTSTVNKKITSRICNKFFEIYK